MGEMGRRAPALRAWSCPRGVVHAHIPDVITISCAYDGVITIKYTRFGTPFTRKKELFKLMPSVWNVITSPVEGRAEAYIDCCAHIR